MLSKTRRRERVGVRIRKTDREVNSRCQAERLAGFGVGV